MVKLAAPGKRPHIVMHLRSAKASKEQLLELAGSITLSGPVVRADVFGDDFDDGDAHNGNDQ